MRGSYEALDRTSMVNDKDIYQGLIAKKGRSRERPKIEPKPRLREVEEQEPSHVKVLWIDFLLELTSQTWNSYDVKSRFIDTCKFSTNWLHW